MQALRRINNNVALCRDGQRPGAVAMGKGVGFGSFPRELALSEIERTFYDTDEKYRQLVAELPEDVLAFGGPHRGDRRKRTALRPQPQCRLYAGRPHQFCHGTRPEEHPGQDAAGLRCGAAVPRRIPHSTARHPRLRKEFCVALPECETAGIAMSLLNSKLTQDEPQSAETDRDEEMLEDVTEIVENELHILVERSGFNYSRYATHMQYLFQRIHTGQAIRATICSCTPACGRSSRRSPPAWKRSPSTSNGNGTAL